MSKFKIIKIAVAVLLVITALVLIACETKSESTSSYVMTVTEKGVEKTYVLTLDEKSGTFSIVDENEEKTYSGTFVFKNGYLILESKANGTEYVKVMGNTFSYFKPDSEPVICTHSYERTEEVSGSCSSKGYIKYTCSLCGDEKKESTEYGDHKYVVKSYTSGDCRNKGYTVKKCSICGVETGKIYDVAFGNHKLTDELRVDNGCNTKVVMRKRCTLCESVFDNVTDEYGSHRYVGGECSVCHYDKAGICHSHTNVNGGICDDCKSNVVATEQIKEKGYYVDGEGMLYMGVYPTRAAEYTAEQIIGGGKYDSETGYYRFNGASYKIEENKNRKKAFLVTVLTWLPTEIDGETRYVCTSVIDRVKYLGYADILPVYTRTDYGAEVEYYNKKHYIENGQNNAKANDFECSDAYAFLCKNLMDTAFTEEQKELIESITLPSEGEKEFFTEHKEAIKNTSYSLFFNNNDDDNGIFTRTAGKKGNSIVILNSAAEEGIVTDMYGIVPIIKLR